MSSWKSLAYHRIYCVAFQSKKQRHQKQTQTTWTSYLEAWWRGGVSWERLLIRLSEIERTCKKEPHHIVDVSLGGVVAVHFSHLSENLQEKTLILDFVLFRVISTGNQLLTKYKWDIEHKLTRRTREYVYWPPESFLGTTMVTKASAIISAWKKNLSLSLFIYNKLSSLHLTIRRAFSFKAFPPTFVKDFFLI